MNTAECVRIWRLNQPEATHHPDEQCCHTAVVSHIPPTVKYLPAKESHLPDEFCGAAPHVILTFMDQNNCTCLQENMIRDWKHTHAFMHGNRTDLLVGTTWDLPSRVGLTHVYPSVLPFGSNSILGSETFYSDSSIAILKFYTPDCMIGIGVALLLCATVTATARQTLKDTKFSTFGYLVHFLDACLLYVSEHFHMGPVQFTDYPALKTLEWLHPTWLLGSFLLYSIASNDLINLLIEPLKSTSYKSIDDVVARNVSGLVVYYFPQSILDLWITSDRIALSHPFCLPTGLYLRNQQNQVFNVEMRRERSIIVADLDELIKRQVDNVTPFGFKTYISLDPDEDSFKYFFTSTTMESAAEQHFRRVYMNFLENGLLVQDVSWDRWEMLLPVRISHAALGTGESHHPRALSADLGQHFEPLKLSGFDDFLEFITYCHTMTFILFASIYGLKWLNKETKKVLTFTWITANQ